MELLGQGAHTLGEQAHSRRRNGELAAAGAHDNALGLDDIAQVEGLDAGKTLLAQVVDAAEELDGARGILELDEDDLALATLGTHATGNAHDVGRVGTVLEGGVTLHQVGDMVADLAVLGIGVDAGLNESRAATKAHAALVKQSDVALSLIGCH